MEGLPMALSLDPETGFLINEGLHQKREVELGRMKLEEATALPEGSLFEGRRVVMLGDAFFKGFGLLIFVPLVAAFVFWVFSILIEYALSEYAEPTTTFYIIVWTIALIGDSFSLDSRSPQPSGPRGDRDWGRHGDRSRGQVMLSSAYLHSLRGFGSSLIAPVAF
jgi:hypothetical protein